MHLRSRVFWIAFILGAITTGAALRGEPYMAVRYGYTCSQCHVNPTGGGKRNRFGMTFSQTTLPNRTIGADDVERFRNWVRPAPPAAPAAGGGDAVTSEPAPLELPSPSKEKPLLRSTFTDGYLTDFLSIGADLRLSERTSFFDPGEDTSSFDLTKGNVYGSLELMDELATLYLDETVAPGGASAREAFGMLRGPAGTWLKGGRLMLPFGLRIQDDEAFIRQRTGFNFGNQDLGMEFGLEPGPISASFAISNGTGGTSDTNRDKQLTGMVGLIRRHWRLGVQGSWNNGPESRQAIFGATAGINIGRLTLLGEADEVIEKNFGTGPGSGVLHALVLYGEVDYLIAKGVNLAFTYDYEDPDTSLSEDQFTRIGGGVECFPTQFTQVRLLYHFRDEAHRSGLPDVGTITLEFHLFF